LMMFDSTPNEILIPVPPRHAMSFPMEMEGVVTVLQVRLLALVENKILTSENELDIIDCPYTKELYLPNHWSFVGAPRTYNPLGSTGYVSQRQYNRGSSDSPDCKLERRSVNKMSCLFFIL
jgi:hypothetical protein